jgi:hypothetical protein
MSPIWCFHDNDSFSINGSRETKAHKYLLYQIKLHDLFLIWWVIYSIITFLILRMRKPFSIKSTLVLMRGCHLDGFCYVPRSFLRLFLWNNFSQKSLVITRKNKIDMFVILKIINEDVTFTLYDQNVLCMNMRPFSKSKFIWLISILPNDILNSDGIFLDHHKSFMIESPSIWSWIFFFDISPTNIINEWINK